MIICVSLSACPCEWVHPGSKDVQTVYYQGVNASQVQVSKYTGARGFRATTGEHVVCRRGFDVIENAFIGKELDEVQLKRVGSQKHAQVKEFFRHPIRVIEQCFNTITENKMFGITIDEAPGDLKYTVSAHTIHLGRMSMGQSRDIAEHKIRYDLCVEQCPHSDIILFGVSRGAATTFNACACNKYDMNKVKLVVLEGCFDSVSSAAHNSSLFLGWKKLEKTFVKKLSSLTQFKDEGISPIKLIADFPEQVPVLFVTSKKDIIVPMASVLNLVQGLKKRGKNPVYMLVLEHSTHPKYMMDDKKDTENYRDCLHALYKQYKLPYISAYAESGEKKQLIAACCDCLCI
jgi:hypothetical protein